MWWRAWTTPSKRGRTRTPSSRAMNGKRSMRDATRHALFPMRMNRQSNWSKRPACQRKYSPSITTVQIGGVFYAAEGMYFSHAFPRFLSPIHHHTKRGEHHRALSFHPYTV